MGPDTHPLYPKGYQGPGSARQGGSPVLPGDRSEPTPEQAVQQRREDVLEALNPEASFRSKYAALLTELVPGISQAEIDDATQDHLKFARAGLQAPITDEELDWGLASYISLLDGDSIMNVYDALMEMQRRTGRTFPNTLDAIDEMGLLGEEEEDY
jgi:hypothetical protein